MALGSEYGLTALSKFQLYIDNSEQENKLEDDDSLSTCSSFETIMDINMAPILYLRSCTAKIAVTDFSVSDLPLAVTTHDFIDIQCSIDLDILQTNRIFNKAAVEQLKRLG